MQLDGKVLLGRLLKATSGPVNAAKGQEPVFDDPLPNILA